jgi:hypothetical protein
MKLTPAEFYAQNRERGEISNAEWAARQPFGRFELAYGVDDWAQSIVAGTALGTVPLTPETATQWAPIVAPQATATHADPLWWVINALVARAVEDKILLPPEPGTVKTSYSTRDNNDRTDGIGWGFEPEAAKFLVVHASWPVQVDQVAGGPDVVGAASITQLIRLAAGALNSPKKGPSRTD